MKREMVIGGILICGNLLASTSHLEVVPEAQPQRVFGGENRRITVQFHNPAQQVVKSELRTRLYQTGGAVAAVFDETRWKELEVLAGQTVVESARLNFPQMRGETLFLVQWITDVDQVVGVTEVMVYPTNLLSQLKPVALGEPVGVFDPGNSIKPALTAAGVEYRDLDSAGAEHLHLIVATISKNDSPSGKLNAEIKAVAEKGGVVIWVQAACEDVTPAIVFPQGKGAVAVVSAEAIRALAENPVAQLHLAGVARAAARPEFWMAAPPSN